jgi:hypothetical protein
MAIKRIIQENQDNGSLDSTQYNKQAGAQKQVDVGANLKPLNASATTYTTDASTAKALSGKGKSIAVYNSAGTAAAITLGTDNTVAALAPGACDANGNVGIPCAPNDWTNIACYDKQWVRSSAATLMVFEIVDDTSVQTVN